MNKKIYVLSCCENGGIYGFHLENNILRQTEFVPADRPMYAVISNGRLYAILKQPFENSKNSGIISYQINENGQLSDPSSLLSTLGEGGCHLCVNKEQIYAVNYSSGSVIKLPDKKVVHKGCSIDKDRQEAAHTHYVTVSPDQKYILVTDLGLDKIMIYDSELNLRSETNTVPGAGPRHLAFSEDKEYCYCVNELNSTITVYRYSEGRLTLLNSYKTLPENSTCINYPAAIRVSEGYVYVSNRGHNSISCFQVKGSLLELKSNWDCGGDFPRDFNITDKFLICANERDNSVTVFWIKSHTELELVQKISVEKALCVVAD